MIERQMARHLAIAAMRCGEEVGSLRPILRQHCAAEEYAFYAEAFARVDAAIETGLLAPLYAAHPDLQADIATSIEAFGMPL